MSSNTTEFTDVRLTEWDRLGDLFESFCRGYLDADEDAYTCRSGGASVTVTRDGHVDARMPLHEFSADGVETVGIDVEDGVLRFEVGEVRYRFKQP